MKYESAILKRLIDTYGVVGNPRYISEIIKEFIVRGKERFPNLFTYQADWLAHIDEFGLSPTYTVSYTGQSFYAPNTLERPVKSAILSGQTLVNLVEAYNVQVTSASSKSLKYIYGSLDTSKSYLLQYRVNQLPELTDTSDRGRAFKFEWYNGSVTKSHLNVYNKDFVVGKSNTHIIEPYTGDVTRTNFGVYCTNYVSGVLDIDIMIIEYQDGMENWDIPYFTGMQSVKMPVLTTVGKNLFPTNNFIECGTDNRMIGQYIYEVYLKSGNYCSSFVHADDSDKDTALRYEILDEQDNQVLVLGSVDRKFTIENDGVYKLTFGRGSTYYDTYTKIRVQIEEGSKPSSYESYKSNILSTSEDVTLRGVGDVQDELDLLTGEVTERIGEIVLDGSENWSRFSENRFHLKIDNWKLVSTITTNAKADKINVVPYSQYKSSSSPNISRYNSDNYGIFLYTGGSGWCEDDVTSLKTKLQSNPITIQYELATESIKTVDLTILDQNGQSVDHLKSFNGGTHVYTSSLERSLVPSVDISVVTNLEETLKICSLEGNTM